MKLVILMLTIIPIILSGQSINATYDAGDIPTAQDAFDPSCNGPGTTLEIILPSGGPWLVTGIDIEYSMTAQGGGWKSHQRSQVHCQNSNTTETEIYEGSGNNGGIQAYARNGVTIANGSYAGNTTLVLEMRAWQVSGGGGCATTLNKVNNFTWIITVYYELIPAGGSVGIGTTTPDSSAQLELSSLQKGFLPPRMQKVFRDAIPDPAEGLIVYCTDCAPSGLYHFNGSIWKGASARILEDNDLDTYVTVEKNVDEDKIRFATDSLERMIISHDGKIGIGNSLPNYTLDIIGQGTRGINIVDSANVEGASYAIYTNQGGSASGAKYGSFHLIGNSNSSSHIGTWNKLNGSGSGLHTGTRNELTQIGTGNSYGTYNQTSILPALGSHYGTFNGLTHSGGGGVSLYGSRNVLSGNGSGSYYGTSTNVSSAGTAVVYGTYNIVEGFGAEAMGTRNEIDGGGDGLQYGTYNYMNGGGDGTHYATYNKFNDSGSGAHYGTWNEMTAGTGKQYGTYTNIENYSDSSHYGAYMVLSGSGSGEHYGVKTELYGSGTGRQQGLYNEISNSGDDFHIGTTNNLYGSGTGTHIGTHNMMAGYGSGPQYGIANSIANFGDGDHYGIKNYFNGTSIGNGDQYGISNEILTGGNGIHRGIHCVLAGTGTGIHYGAHHILIGPGAGTQYGVYNTISNSGAANHYGTKNDLTGSGIGQHFGAYNDLSGAGEGFQYGAYNIISNSGDGSHHGVRNFLNGNGAGEHFGTKNNLLGNGEGRQYGTFTEITNDGDNTHYGSANYLTGNGSGTHFGTRNDLTGSGTGSHYGVYNSISSTGSAVKYGTRNDISGSSSGTHYGTRIDLSGTGSGTKYGVYSTVAGASGTTYAGYFNGDVTVTGTFNNPSDQKLKRNISMIPQGTSLEKLKAVHVYQYTYDIPHYPFMALPDATQTGVLAQEVQEVFPDLVKTNIHPAFVPDSEYDGRPATPEVEYLGVNYMGLIPHLVSAAQDLAAHNTALTHRVDQQQGIIISLQEQLADHRKKIESLEAMQDQMASQLDILLKQMEK